MKFNSLEIADDLHTFVETELLPDSGVTSDQFWRGLEKITAEFTSRNTRLLERRDELQQQIDDWHIAHRDQPHDADVYADFLREIGYLDYVSDDVEISTTNVDTEISSVAAPQLVVPLDNARYALNAANARWGSLYDAIYSTDVIDEGGGCAQGRRYNPIRGRKVVEFGRTFLDQHFALDTASHHWATKYFVSDGDLAVQSGDGTVSHLIRPDRFRGYTGDPSAPTTILLEKNGLGCEIRIDGDHVIGRVDAAGVSDIHIESAVTSIMDCEDSVSAVDTEDKIRVYRNWLGLMKGTLTETFVKGGEEMTRELEPDRQYIDSQGEDIAVPGRALMLVRNVGHHLTTDSVTVDGDPIYETTLDAMVTALAAKHDLLGNGVYRNSRAGSVNIVKPKMHGPDEVALACDLFTMVEEALGLDHATLKMGIMDEERRTSLGLKAAIAVARERLVFINTGFLDRTGDEIHTSMEAGPMVPKSEMKSQAWLPSYEDSNVDTGLACGLAHRAQIGKGMWAMPSEMADMIKTKIAHPLSGATTAWVPSPTAATLHALHYFTVDVSERQRDLSDRTPGRVADMITIPVLAADRTLTDDEIQRDVENNLQGILGYVVRWVGAGVGCSTVSNIDDVGLMEDLATLRISSQHVANWLHHGIVNEADVHASLVRMAAVVDQQNSSDPTYEPMATNLEHSVPFQAALDLVLKGREQKNGYTEAILRSRRRQMKESTCA